MDYYFELYQIVVADSLLRMGKRAASTQKVRGFFIWFGIWDRFFHIADASFVVVGTLFMAALLAF